MFRLEPSEHLSQAELDAAELVRLERFNAQLQPQISWPNAVPVARAYLDQLVRHGRILDLRAGEVSRLLDRAARGQASSGDLRAAADALDADAAAVRTGTLGGDAERLSKLAGVLRGLAAG